MTSQKFAGFFLLFILILIAGWVLIQKISTPPPASQSMNTTVPVPIVASFYPLAFFTQQIGRNLINVQTLVEPGIEPHDFEPSPQDIVAIEKAKLFIYNGAGLETWAPRIIQNLATEKVVETTANIPLLQKNSTPDPHVWLNPRLALQEVQNITTGLIRVQPSYQTEFEQNSTQLQNQLTQLDQDFQHGLRNCQLRTIVTSHDAFAYLAKQYDIRVLSIAGLSPDEEPTPQKLAEVAQFTRQNQVKYIFFESLVSPKLAETIAQETGAQTLAFNPLEGLTEAEIAQGQDYFTVQLQNLTNLQQALDCK